MAVQPRRPQTSLGKALELGIQLGACVLVGVAIGYYLDEWLGTEPVLLLVFMVLGFAAAMRTVLRFARESAERAAQKGSEE